MKQLQKDIARAYLFCHGATHSDADLAMLLQVKKETVAQARRDLGIDAFTRREAIANDPDFETASPKELGERYNYDASSLSKFRCRMLNPPQSANEASAWINPILREWAKGHVELMNGQR